MKVSQPQQSNIQPKQSTKQTVFTDVKNPASPKIKNSGMETMSQLARLLRGKLPK